MSANRDADKPAVDWRLETCLTCGSNVHVVGHTTMHYEPVFLAQHNAMAKALALEVDKNSALQMTATALKRELDSLKRIEHERIEKFKKDFNIKGDIPGARPPRSET